MTIYEENGEIHIIADAGKCVRHKDGGVEFYEVWLAEDDFAGNWIELDAPAVETEEK